MNSRTVKVSEARISSLVRAGVPEKLNALILEALSLGTGQKPFIDKAGGLMEIAGRISDLVTPHTPCVKGCNHCCYMAVAVSDFEASMISLYLNRSKQEMAGVSIDRYSEPSNTEATVKKYTGVACSLLGEDGKCTVYPVRPIACRTHHNLAMDETNCIIVTKDGEPLPTTPSLNLNHFLSIHTWVFIEGNVKFADLRDWFPAQTEHKDES